MATGLFYLAGRTHTSMVRPVETRRRTASLGAGVARAGVAGEQDRGRHRAGGRPATYPRRICGMPGVAERFARTGLIPKVLRYGAGSIVATVCSETTFLILYGPVNASTTVSSSCAWLAGALPNYLLNRSWTWGRRGRPSVTRELLPYAAIILGTLGVAIVATTAGAAALRGTSVSDACQTVLVAGIYFLSYAVMFVFRFLLFDRLFAMRQAPPEGG